MIAITAVAWIALASRAATEGHARAHGAQTGFAIGEWVVMVAAMMFPLILPSVRHAASHSLWPRRHRAIAVFLCGYSATWLLFGVAALGLFAAMDFAHHAWTLPLGLALAAAWQFVPAKCRAARACHRTMPLAPSGLVADRDCLRYGWMVGVPCIITCWPLMATCAVSHNLPAMMGASLITSLDRYAFRPRTRLTVAALSAMAIAFFLMGR